MLFWAALLWHSTVVEIFINIEETNVAMTVYSNAFVTLKGWWYTTTELLRYKIPWQLHLYKDCHTCLKPIWKYPGYWICICYFHYNSVRLCTKGFISVVKWAILYSTGDSSYIFHLKISVKRILYLDKTRKAFRHTWRALNMFLWYLTSWWRHHMETFSASWVKQ